MHVLSTNLETTAAKLSEAAEMLKGHLATRKPKGFDGSEVERYFREGKIKEIAEYCETDVVGTYQVWLRYELFRGTLSQNAFEASQRNLRDFINRR